jgi:hypothetical protein
VPDGSKLGSSTPGAADADGAAHASTSAIASPPILLRRPTDALPVDLRWPDPALS